MMNWMTGWLCFGMASAAFAGEVAIGWRENGGADVPAGETAQQTERVAIDPEGNFLKTGAGTLEMPLGTVDNAIPSTVKVLAGTLKLTTAAAPEADVAHPPAILDTAAFWVDAMPDAGLVISNGTATAESDTTPAYALRWLDRRETNPDAPTRLYADAAWTNNTESALWGVPPAVVNVDGRRAVFFGGAHSGQYMSFRFNGAYRRLDNIYSYYLVFGVTNSMGLVLGNRGDSKSAFFRINTWRGSGSFFFGRNDVGNTRYSARHYLDGQVFDPFEEAPKYGFQLFNSYTAQMLDANSQADAFYDGYSNSQNEEGTAGHTGGDYLCEAIIFTNAIPQAARVQVERYLMAKWRLPHNRHVHEPVWGGNTCYATAAGSVLEVSVPAGDYAPAVRLGGEGTVVKTGTGTMTLGPSHGAPFTGAFDLQEGSVFTQGGPLPALAVPAGTRLHAGEINTNGLPEVASAAYESGAGTLTTLASDAPADTVVKSGEAPARIRTLGAGVRKLKVEAGLLTLEGGVRATSLAADGAISATIPNPNFEVPPTQPRSGNNTVYYNFSSLSGDLSWKALGAAENSQILTSVPNRAGGNAWGTWCNAPCPEGTNVLYLISNARCYTTVTFPKSGYYCFSALASARYRASTTERGAWYNVCDVALGETLDTCKRVGTILASHNVFRRFYCSTFHVEAGVPYVLVLSTRSSLDSGVALDDLRLDYIPDVPRTARAYAIPNGDFDNLDPIAHITSPVAGNTTKYWTLSDDVYGTVPAALIVNPATTLNYGVLYTTAAPYWNTAQLLLCRTGRAETTFTPPAGTYRLRGRVARWRGAWPGASTVSATAPALEARVTLGEAAQSLGTYTAASERLVENIWPVTFTVDGATAVTLSLALPAADGAVLVDDLDLVGDTPGDVELLTDTACETGTAWKKLNPWPAALGNGAVQAAEVRNYDGFLRNGEPFGQYWGYNRFNGSKFLFLVENGGMQQTVNIPKAGIYRLVYHERSRKGTHNGANPVMAWIRNAAGTYTNMIARSTAHCSTNFVEYTCHFRLPAAGEYVLAFQGTGYNWATKPNEDIESLVDGVSLTYETGTLNETPDVPEWMSIDVAPHAILALDFPGTLKVRRLHLGGLPVSGHVDATTHPAYLTGMGALDAPPAGSVFLLR